MYKKALEARPNRASRKLKERFIEMTIMRSRLVLTEANSEMEAIPLYMEDIDSVMAKTSDINDELKKEYADFLVLLADSILVNGKLSDALDLIDKAADVAANPSRAIQKKDSLIEEYTVQNIEMAKNEYETGIENKDPLSLISAEYHLKAALLFDSTDSAAQELLSKVKQKNIDTYSAYTTAVGDDIPDSNIYNRINVYDILMAISLQSRSGNVLRLKTRMYNYSNNPQRLRHKNFSVVDVNGREYTALASSRIPTEILDQEHETKMNLVFPAPSAAVKKLVYENGEYYSEKHFR
jgi:hypothetical protein